MHRLCAALLLVLSASTAAQDPPVLLLKLDTDLGLDDRDTRAIIPGDFDLDGDIDVYIANFAQDNILYKGRGNGTFDLVEPQPINTDGGFTFDGAWGDIDGDGDLDLAVANGHLMDNAIYRNMGVAQNGTTGRFAKLTGDPAVSDGGESYGVAWGDIDNDGDLDLAFANKFSANFLYTNDGLGAFTKVTAGDIASRVSQSRDVAIVDLDNDGDSEVAYANSSKQANDIWVNQGGDQAGTVGAFALLTSDPFADEASSSRAIAFADYDGDGLLDAMVANQDDQANSLFHNLGGMSFERTDLAPSNALGNSYSAAWGDLDGDSDLDLVIANREQVNFFYRNMGVDGFEAMEHGILSDAVGNSRHVAIADFNLDGRREVVVANTLGESNYYFSNEGKIWKDLGFALQRGNADDGDPEPRLTASGALTGDEWVNYYIDFAPADATSWLIVSLDTVFSPFKGGTLVPDPDFIVRLPKAKPTGKLDLSFRMPNTLPSGITIFHQVWSSDDSNAAGLCATNGLSGTTL
ncbi:MAG: hypothetical protein DHS20C15_16340 [Planctomycetota bacterium]|nr:MAG: hypothetical protein DHS20C15_16340 [Planctomycetota bacterium]